MNKISDSEFENKIKSILHSHFYQSEIRDICFYSLFPAGKLFRPKLVMSIAYDQNISSVNLDQAYQVAAGIEAHHCCSLIHDDLPSMDDDDYRRGRLSSHKKFCEWKAILAGDSLLNISHHIFSNLKKNTVSKIAGWFLGPKGLILGQCFDLDPKPKDFSKLIEIHRLKTARLIQLSILSGYIVSVEKVSQKTFRSFYKLGDRLGIFFQILDDLTELTEKEINKRENEVNLFLIDPNKAQELLKSYLQNIHEIINQLNLEHTSKFFKAYIEKIIKKLHDRKVSDFDTIITPSLSCLESYDSSKF